jgi:hypothetical protein
MKLDSKVEEALQLLSDVPASIGQQEFPATHNMKPFEWSEVCTQFSSVGP